MPATIRRCIPSCTKAVTTFAWTPARRRLLDTNAGSDEAEENAVCYLQILLADEIDSLGRERMFSDMDSWGYSFRLGSSRAWFEEDAEDALGWLITHCPNRKRQQNRHRRSITRRNKNDNP